MEKLIEKVENLKASLNHNSEIIKIKHLNNTISNDKELLKLIEEYKQTQDPKLKNKIISNQNFKNYKKQETNINLIILEINQKLKEIKDKGKCSL